MLRNYYTVIHGKSKVSYETLNIDHDVTFEILL